MLGLEIVAKEKKSEKTVAISASTETHLAQINLVLQFREFLVEVYNPRFRLFELCLLTKNVVFDLFCWEGKL